MILDKFIELQRPQGRAQFQALVRDATIVKIQNVSDYLYQSPQEFWGSEDFPCVAPPWEKTWMEWRTPSSWLSDQEPLPDMSPLISWKNIGPNLWRIYGPPFERGALFVASEYSWAAEIGARWMLTCVGMSAEAQDGFLFEYKFFITPEGQRIDLTNTPEHKKFIKSYVMPEGDLDPIWKRPAPLLLPRIVSNTIANRALRGEQTIDHAFFDVCWLALSFCNCKNVERVENKPAEKVQQKRVKHGKPPLNSFYTLQIGPIQKILSRSTEPGASLKKQLHIVRGHFKIFDERPLFGKHRGAFWWPMHERGQGEKSVEKQYEVNSPQGDRA